MPYNLQVYISCTLNLGLVEELFNLFNAIEEFCHNNIFLSDFNTLLFILSAHINDFTTVLNNYKVFSL